MKKFDKITYDALEKMKDGEAFASKYDSQQLKMWLWFLETLHLM